MRRTKEPVARVARCARAPRALGARVVWMLERQPGFNERLERGQAQLAAGDAVPFREVRGRR